MRGRQLGWKYLRVAITLQILCKLLSDVVGDVIYNFMKPLEVDCTIIAPLELLSNVSAGKLPSSVDFQYL